MKYWLGGINVGKCNFGPTANISTKLAKREMIMGSDSHGETDA